MAQADGFEGFSAFPVESMDGIVARPSEGMKDVYDIARGGVLIPNASKDLYKVCSFRQIDGGEISDEGCQSLGELPRLDQRCVRVLNKVALGEASERSKACIKLLQMVEVGTWH